MKQAIAHYNLLERVGEGGLGEVYRARDTIAGRTVALKLARAERFASPEERERFLADASQAATLSHPNIATLWDVGEDGGRLYLAYEFIAGDPLRALMAGRPMNIRHALELAVQVADALSEGHARGIAHGDLRPDTIAVSGKGSAKVLDFGMSRWTRGGAIRARAAADASALRPDSAAVVAYMSPEQVLGQATDERSDLFTLAVIVYEMLTGRHPFSGGAPAEVLASITTRTPPSVRITHSDLPKELDAAFQRGLAKDRARRHQSAATLAADLRRALAAIDARAGDGTRRDLLPLDDEDRGSRAWIVYLLIAAAIAAGWWLLR
jgi:eukaryotic-like serine/threonine-protein kinase